MEAQPPHLLEAILRWCEAAAPEPWYPKRQAEQHAIARDSLDPPLEALRLGGWIQLTDWMAGKGQGYRLTEAGQGLLANRVAMAGVHLGKLPVVEKPAEPAPINRAEREAALDVVETVQTPPTVRNVLVVVNCVMFLGGLAVASQTGRGQDYVAGVNIGKLLDELGALYGPRLLEGEWWRLLTSCFLHDGWAHLAMNMLSLYVIGSLAERMWGHWRFLLLYLLSGLGGSCLMAAWMPLNPVVGASGAIFGVFAGQAMWLVLNRGHLEEDMAARWLRNVIIIGLMLAYMSTGERVAWLAHLGGALTGGLTAILVQYQRFGGRLTRVLASLGLVALPAGLIGLVLLAMERTPDWNDIRARARLLEVARRPAGRRTTADHDA